MVDVWQNILLGGLYEFFDVSKFNHYCLIDGTSHHDSYRDAFESCDSTGIVYIGEVLACLLFYTTTTMPNIDLVYVVFVLVGGGTVVHSMVDGYISLYIYKAIPGLSKTGNK